MDGRLKDRAEAGRLLADRLSALTDREDVLVLALPRGGVPVAFEIAKRLNAPLDVFVVRKLGVPWQEELGMGAIASGGVVVLNHDVIRALNITDRQIGEVKAKELRELERRERAFRGDRPAPDLRARTVILVDNGVATGTTMLAAIAALRKLSPARIIVAVSVAPRSTYEQLLREADEVIALIVPDVFYAVSLWYEDFSQTSDAEVRDLLDRSMTAEAAHATAQGQ